MFKSFQVFQDFQFQNFQKFHSVQDQCKWRRNPEGTLGPHWSRVSPAMIKSKGARFSQGRQQISTTSFSWVSLSLACSSDGSCFLRVLRFRGSFLNARVTEDLFFRYVGAKVWHARSHKRSPYLFRSRKPAVLTLSPLILFQKRNIL